MAYNCAFLVDSTAYNNVPISLDVVANKIDDWALSEITTNGVQLRPVKYQERFGLLIHAKELRLCCLSIGYR